MFGVHMLIEKRGRYCETTFHLYYVLYWFSCEFRLVCEAKVQSLVSSIRRSLEIIFPFLRTHCVPNSLPSLILPDVVEFCQNIQSDIKSHDPQQNFVPTLVVWCIVGAIKVGGDYTANLAAHVVKRRGNCSCSDGICVTRLKIDLYSVDVGVRKQEGENGEPHPRKGLIREGL